MLRRSLALLPLLFASAITGAAQTPVGSEFQITKTAAVNVANPSVRQQDSGEFIVTWRANSGGDVFGRSFAADDVPVGVQYKVHVYDLYNQTNAVAVARADGDFTVVFLSGTGYEHRLRTWARRISPAGVPRGSEFTMTTGGYGNAVNGVAAAELPGNAFLAVTDECDASCSGRGIFGVVKSATDTTVSQFQVKTGDNEGHGPNHAVAAAPDGSFLVVWADLVSDPYTYTVMARPFSSAATPLADAFQIHAATSVPGSLAMARSSSGRHLVTWRGAPGWSAVGQVLEADGTPVGSSFVIGSNAGYPSVTTDSAGNFLVVWPHYIAGSYEVIGRVLDPAGTPVGAEFTVNAIGTGDQSEAVVSDDGRGTFVVAWSGPDATDGVDRAVFARRFESIADYGDAPSSYATLRADDGARHVFGTLRLGNAADFDADGAPSALADGDGPDDDGVAFNSGLRPGSATAVDVIASGAALLDAWVDFDGDGAWSAAEQVFASTPLSTGVNPLSFPVPSDAQAGATFARFRISGAGGLAPTGLAPDGEVEDYTIGVEPIVGITDATVAEGNSGTIAAAFTVTLSGPSPDPLTVDYATSGGTATSGNDFVAASGSLTFAPGQTAQSFDVQVKGDVIDELDEAFVVNLSDASSGVIGDGQGTATIVDDDAPPPGSPTISVGDVSATEGAPLVFTVTLSASSASTVSVGYATAPGTAGAGDFTSRSGRLTFSAGQTSKTLPVLVTDDLVDEPAEMMTLNLSLPLNATLADGQGTGTIVDDDATPSLTILDASLVEGDSGGTPGTFTVQLSAASGQTVSVQYATATTGGAVAGVDYVTTSGTLTFAPGATAATLAVTVIGDVLDEVDEKLYVDLSAATNATVADGQGRGTIVDDDPLPLLTISDARVGEDDTGTSPLTFTVTLSAGSGRNVDVDFASTTAGLATPGVDYTAKSGHLTFMPGQTLKTFRVYANGDTADEANENLFVNLAAPTNATLADGQGEGEIVDDDPTAPGAPSVAVGDVSVSEADSGTTPATFTITLSPASADTIDVTYETGTAGTATSGVDYQPKSLSVTFQPGQTVKTVNVLVNGDTLDEANETFFFNLTSAGGAIIADAQGRGTIIDNDAVVTVSIGDTFLDEPDSGTAPALFTVSLSGPSGVAVSVQWATGAGGSATSGGDYAASSGTVTFAPGQTTATVPIDVMGDLIAEHHETFFVNLTNAVNATRTDSQGLCTILNEDTTPGLSIGDYERTEPSSGVTAFFTVTLTRPGAETVSVDYATADVTATAGADYSATSGTLTFAPGATQKLISLQILPDSTIETTETFRLVLSNPVNGLLVDPEGVGTIYPDGDDYSLSIADASVVEGTGGTSMATFTVTLNESRPQTVTVNYTSGSAGTAISGVDYTAVFGNLTFPQGTLTRTLQVPVNADALDEPNETMYVNLSGATNAVISDSQGKGTIVDDDP